MKSGEFQLVLFIPEALRSVRRCGDICTALESLLLLLMRRTVSRNVVCVCRRVGGCKFRARHKHGESSLGYQTISQFTRAIAQRNYLISSHLNCGKQRSESYIPKGQA